VLTVKSEPNWLEPVRLMLKLSVAAPPGAGQVSGSEAGVVVSEPAVLKLMVPMACAVPLLSRSLYTFQLVPVAGGVGATPLFT
jgi:hypothetical protein